MPVMVVLTVLWWLMLVVGYGCAVVAVVCVSCDCLLYLNILFYYVVYIILIC